MSFTCKHCKQDYANSAALTNDKGEKFCCAGCLKVYEFLQANDLAEFYDRLGKVKLQKASEERFSEAAIENFYKNFVTTKDGVSEMFLVVKGITCAACVWLVEKVLSRTEGVLEINISGANAKANIKWDESQISLAQILSTLSLIGYSPLPYSPLNAENAAKNNNRQHYAKLLVAVACLMNLMWIAVALYSGYFSGLSQAQKDILHFAEFILASPVLFYTGSEFYKSAFVALKNRSVNMDLSVIGGATAAYAYSVWAMLTRAGEVYFDSVAMVVCFVFIGKYFQQKVLLNAVDFGDSLGGFALSKVRILRGEKVEFVEASEVEVGEVMLVENGEKLLLDGECVEGDGLFDYSVLTGESLPVSVKAGESLTSGGVCVGGLVKVKSSKKFNDSSLNQLVRLIETSRLKKGKLEVVANLISAKFSLTILLLAVAAFVWWSLAVGVEKGVVVGISVLIISCPCALSLATPVASLVGLNRTLREGLVCKESSVLEKMASCQKIVFDKTGTLTKGQIRVKTLHKFADFNQSGLLFLTQNSSHLVSRCVSEFLRVNLSKPNLSEFSVTSVVGGGLKGGGFVAGSAKFLEENGVVVSKQARTLLGANLGFFVAFEGVLVALFELEDEMKKESFALVKGLQKLGYKVAILSGDRQETTRSVADALGVTEVVSNASPQDKLDFITSQNPCIFVGDGVNDAAAIGRASVGIALSSASSLSLQNADATFIGGLEKLASCVKIAKQTKRRIHQNLAISLAYNAAAIPLAFCGVVIPLVAAAVMSLSSICVVLNAVRK